MYRAVLVIALLTYCSTAPFNSITWENALPISQEQRFGLQQQTNMNTEQNDDSDIVDNTGAGYSYFKKQQLDVRPLAQSPAPISKQDLSEYMQSSALKQQPAQTQISSTSIDQSINGASWQQQQTVPRSNQQLAFDQMQQENVQPVFTQQQRNAYGQFAPQDVQIWPPQQPQILIPRTNLNLQQKILSGYGNQQGRSFVQQPRQTWNTQQDSTGFTSSYGGQGQQNGRLPVTNAMLMSSQLPNRMFVSQIKPIFNSGSSTGW